MAKKNANQRNLSFVEFENINEIAAFHTNICTEIFIISFVCLHSELAPNDSRRRKEEINVDEMRANNNNHNIIILASTKRNRNKRKRNRKENENRKE